MELANQVDTTIKEMHINESRLFTSKNYVIK